MNLTAKIMMEGFANLNKLLDRPVRLILGGGGAMLLAHKFRLVTQDVDAIPGAGITVDELDPYVRRVAREIGLPPDWLNPYYSTFAHVLPSDYATRLIRIADLSQLKVDALSKEDLLIMKCFAARAKDVVHARALVKLGADVDFVRTHIESLRKRKIPGSDKALSFLSQLEEFFRKDEK